ncbi:hypothetical protein Pint_13970 [Pistacia integerrima]|uniref:Uncharacterized protein n=1 Tax=Pistacia integerrima TaxID=434235 RepID=A0ACC0YA66_9ROSI|nr:hypothetical protein Pint_13970 [Pistacia integerrima]
MPSLAPFDVNGTKEERQMTKKIALQSLDATDFSTEMKKKKDSKNKADDSERWIEAKAEVLADNHSWRYAKRFLHPDVVAAYEYIFIWDEDLGVEHFNEEK